MGIKEQVLNETKWADLYQNPDILEEMMEVELAIESLKAKEPTKIFDKEEDEDECDKY